MKWAIFALMLIVFATSQRLTHPTYAGPYTRPVGSRPYGYRAVPTSPALVRPANATTTPVVEETPAVPEVPAEKKEESAAPTIPNYFHNLNHKTGDDILHKLKAGNHDIYVMVFFQSTEGNQHLDTINRQTIDKLENNFLFKNDIKDLYYTTIDASKPTYAGLLSELDIQSEELSDSPVIFIMEHGNGFIMTGPRAISEMKMNLNELLENRDHGY